MVFHSQKYPTYSRGKMQHNTLKHNKVSTKTHTVQWSSNIKGSQVSPAQDISEVCSVPLGLYVLSEWNALPSAAVPSEAAHSPPDLQGAPLAVSQTQSLWPCLSATGRTKKQQHGTNCFWFLHKWRHSWAFKLFFSSALSLLWTEKLEMSSIAWPRHSASLSCSQDC